MEKPTVLGYMKDQPRALRAAFARRAEFVEPFRQLFEELPIKKCCFSVLVLPTTHRRSQLMSLSNYAVWKRRAIIQRCLRITNGPIGRAC